MTSIKTIKEGFTIVLLFVAGILLYNFSLNQAPGQIFSSLSKFSYINIKWEVVAFIASGIGSYFYLLKNVWIGFKSKTVITILILIAIIQMYSSIALYFSFQNFEKELLDEFQKIPFPIEEDFVKKNIKISVVEYTNFLLFTSFLTGLLGLVVGNIQLVLFRRKSSKN